MNRKRKPQARLVDEVQAMRVTLAIRWGLPASEVGRWRAEYEIAAERGEEVLIWQG